MPETRVQFMSVESAAAYQVIKNFISKLEQKEGGLLYCR
jgi:hypothetical protein